MDFPATAAPRRRCTGLALRALYTDGADVKATLEDAAHPMEAIHQ